MPKLYKCIYKHCKHEDCMVSVEDSVKISNKHYHSDCAANILNIREINALYRNNISDTVVQMILGKVINDIVFGKNVDSEFLLYSLKYAIHNKIRISSPYGLHYLIDNKNIKIQYKKSKVQHILMNTDSTLIETEIEDVITYKQPNLKNDCWGATLFK